MSDHSDPEDTPEQPDEIQADAELGVAEQVADGAVPTEAAVGAVQAAADFGRVGELVASSVLNMKNLADIRRHLPSKAALKAEFGEGEVFELKIKRKEELEKYIDGQTLQGQEYRMSVCDAYAKIGGVKRNFERLWNTVVTGGFNDEILKVVEKDFALLQDATPELEALQKEMAAKARTDLKKIQEDIKELSMGGSEHLNNLIKEIDATTSAVLAATKELRDEELKFHTANTKNIINLAHLDNTLTSAKEQKEAATKEIEKLRADYETSVAAHKDAKTQN